MDPRTAWDDLSPMVGRPLREKIAELFSRLGQKLASAPVENYRVAPHGVQRVDLAAAKPSRHGLGGRGKPTLPLRAYFRPRFLGGRMVHFIFAEVNVDDLQHDPVIRS